MKIATRKLMTLSLANKQATVLEVLACVVLNVANNRSEIGYNLKTPLCSFNIISVRKRFSLNERLDNEFGSILKFNWQSAPAAVCVRACTKGKGFAGVIKKHGFSGLRSSHGVSLAHRSCGAIGARQDPGKVWKGKKMAGRMGGTSVTIRGLRVARYDSFTEKLMLYGSVPGNVKGSVIVNDNINNSQ
ncbi:50S ribosomal protein L3 [Candidatus Hodgkinia cicadicola]